MVSLSLRLSFEFYEPDEIIHRGIADDANFTKRPASFNVNVRIYDYKVSITCTVFAIARVSYLNGKHDHKNLTRDYYTYTFEIDMTIYTGILLFVSVMKFHNEK